MCNEENFGLRSDSFLILFGVFAPLVGFNVLVNFSISTLKVLKLFLSIFQLFFKVRIKKI